MALADILFMSDTDVFPMPLVVGSIVKINDVRVKSIPIPAVWPPVSGPVSALPEEPVVVPQLPIPDDYTQYSQERFNHAIVVSVSPIVLVSEKANMRWTTNIDLTKFIVVGKASDDVLTLCMTRLNA